MLVKLGSTLWGQSASKPLLKYNHLPFQPITMARAGGHQRKLLVIWLLVCLLTIPSAVVTRVMDWTGLPVDVAGITVHLSIYLPLIACIPLVLWMGFLWGAIPAYLSTFVVAYYGGMPLPWIIVFSFANPLGLAMYTLVYRVTSLRIDLTNLPSVIGFAFVSLLSAVTGSTGSFVWAYTVNQGITDTYPVWQGWWLGGWFQALIVVGPILFLFSDRLFKLINAPHPKKESLDAWRRKFFAALIAGLLVLISYAAIARIFSIAETNEALKGVQSAAIRHNILNAIDSLTYPIFVLLGVIITSTYFIYRAVRFWTNELVKANRKLAASNKRLGELASTDALTNISNRRSIMEKLEIALARSARDHLPLSIIMVDADYFKRVNDTYGHTAGDSVLQQLTLRMLGQLRDYDYIGRYGGEEFIIVLPHSALKETLIIAERLRCSINSSPIVTSFGEIDMTISLGLAQWTPKDDTTTRFIARADSALIESKQNGRNRVSVAKNSEN